MALSQVRQGSFERENWKVICVRLVEDLHGGLANFVIWF